MITTEIVRKVAALAHLELSQAEVERMTAELDVILENIAILGEAETSHIAPTAQVLDLRSVMRDDCARASLPVEAVLANAPDREDGYFRVRAVLKDDEGEARR